MLDVGGQITVGEGTGALPENAKALVDAVHTCIIVSLAEVSYIDSAGLAT